MLTGVSAKNLFLLILEQEFDMHHIMQATFHRVFAYAYLFGKQLFHDFASLHLN